MANRVDYFYFNWGPYLWSTELDKNIIDKLKFDGEKTKIDYNSTLAGHLDNQFGYDKSTQKWFEKEKAARPQRNRDIERFESGMVDKI